MKDAIASLNTDQLSFCDYKLRASFKYIRLMMLVVCLINLLLLIPDLSLITDTSSKIHIILIRSVYSVSLLTISFHIKKIKQFNTFSILITAFELFAIITLLYVISQYDKPDFLIQTFGMITIIVIIYLVPNKWEYMLFTAVAGSAGFFICSFVLLDSIRPIDFAAAVVYVIISILLGAISSKSADKLQQSEFAARSQLELISSTDYLTETANRYKLTEEAKRWIDFCHRQGFPLSVVFIDVDDLKAINDHHGHDMGDSILSELAKIIGKQLRSSDTLARWGGDEFVLLLPNVPLEGTVSLIERIRNSILSHSFRQVNTVTCSFGIAGMEQNDDFNSLLRKADQMMYQSKLSGKNLIKWTGTNYV